MPIPKSLNLAWIWVKQKDLDEVTWLWRVKCAVNVNKERQGLRVLFVFHLTEGFQSAGASFLRFSSGKGLQGCYNNLV